MARKTEPDGDRARRTLYVTGFNPKFTSKRLLEELFNQGGPVTDITMFSTHAYVLFQHEESVPYCLALFNEIELHGQKLRINPRDRSKASFSFMKYLTAVRKKLMDEYRKITPPELPPKRMPERKLPNIDNRKHSNKQSFNSERRQKKGSNKRHARSKGKLSGKTRVIKCR